MGDMADFILDSEVYWPVEEGMKDRELGIKTCMYCGQSGLHWMRMSDNAWRLHTFEGRLHSCL